MIDDLRSVIAIHEFELVTMPCGGSRRRSSPTWPCSPVLANSGDGAISGAALGCGISVIVHGKPEEKVAGLGLSLLPAFCLFAA